MTWPQLVEWRQYYELEPFGSFADSLRQGQTTAMIGNTHLDPKYPPFKATDFLLGPDATSRLTGSLTKKPITDPEEYRRMRDNCTRQ